jgi:hypothetical protein
VVKSYIGAAANIGDKQMRSALAFSIIDLGKIREVNLPDTALMVYNTALPKAKELSIFIDAAEIEKLKTMAVEFKRPLPTRTSRKAKAV